MPVEPIDSNTCTLEQGDSMRNAHGLRVAVLGNMDSYGYRLCKWMRQLGVDAELLLLGAADRNERSRPENVDRQLANGYPDWIKQWQRFDGRLATLAGSYDVAVSIGTSGLKAVTKVGSLPVAHLANGPDVFDRPFQYPLPSGELAQRWDRLRSRLFANRNARQARGQTIDVRQSLNKVAAIIADFEPVIRAANQLGYGHKVRVWAFPEDVQGNCERVDQTLLRELNRQYRRSERVLIWLSRVNYKDPASNHYKGTEYFLSSLRRLIRDDGLNIRAVVAAHGNDAAEFQREAEDAGINDRIDYLPHLPLWKLLTYLSIDNGIVCDEITSGTFTLSGIARESLSVGAALVTCVDQRLMRLCYGLDAPIATAHDETTCYEQLHELCMLAPDVFRARRESTRDWAMCHLEKTAVMPRLLTLLREMAWLSKFQECNAK